MKRAKKLSNHRALSALAVVVTERVEWAYKPSSVASVHLSRTAVAHSLVRPTRGSYGIGPTPVSRRRLALYLALLRAGFGQPVCLHTAGALLPHHFTLARHSLGDGGRCVSVPLSVGSPRLGVTQRPALRSSDFPHPPSPRLRRTRTLGPLHRHFSTPRSAVTPTTGKAMREGFGKTSTIE